MPEAAIDLSSDQAAGLRRLFGSRAPRVIAFASGRESGGRTTLLVQTATALADSGHGVAIVDENLAPHNAVSAFGLAVRHDLMDAISGSRSLGEVALQVGPRVRVVPAARAAREFDPAAAAERSRLAGCLAEIQHGAAFVLIDCATRPGGQLSSLALAARHLAVVVAAQSSAITHAYALIKQAAAARSGRGGIHVVVTHARTGDDALAIFENMKRVAREHLGVRLEFLGATTTPLSDHLAEALVTRLPPPANLYADGLRKRVATAHRENSVMV